MDSGPLLVLTILAGFLALLFLGLWLSARSKATGSLAVGSAPSPAPASPVTGDGSPFSDEAVKTQKEIIFTLSELVEFRTREPETHVERVAEFARLFGEFLGMAREDAILLTEAAPMHDIGKIGLPDYIINKPGALSTEELAVMRMHTQIGHDILAKHRGPLFKKAALIALEHHERWDGTGYPRSLKGESISLPGRIVALCDVFDSLSNPRPYKEAWPAEKVVNFIKEGSGRHFDPSLVDLMIKHIDRFLVVLVRMKDR